MSGDPLIRGFVNLKALIMEAVELYGEEQGHRMVALAGVMVDKAKAEGNVITRREAFDYIREEMLGKAAGVNPTSVIALGPSSLPERKEEAADPPK